MAKSTGSIQFLWSIFKELSCLAGLLPATVKGLKYPRNSYSSSPNIDFIRLSVKIKSLPVELFCLFNDYAPVLD